MASLANSEGWTVKAPSWIQRRAPKRISPSPTIRRRRQDRPVDEIGGGREPPVVEQGEEEEEKEPMTSQAAWRWTKFTPVLWLS